ncbi:hypothetical protein Mapa_017537 [Marchantia paleacea]|nr:hypothetical protein Mapa_017537 [Marchantia paleacea]
MDWSKHSADRMPFSSFRISASVTDSVKLFRDWKLAGRLRNGKKMVWSVERRDSMEKDRASRVALDVASIRCGSKDLTLRGPGKLNMGKNILLIVVCRHSMLFSRHLRSSCVGENFIVGNDNVLFLHFGSLLLKLSPNPSPGAEILAADTPGTESIKLCAKTMTQKLMKDTFAAMIFISPTPSRIFKCAPQEKASNQPRLGVSLKLCERFFMSSS